MRALRVGLIVFAACGGGGGEQPPGADGGVVACTVSSDCDVAQPICADEVCRTCAAPADDAACAARDPSTPKCGPAGQCVECVSHGDCASGLCLDDRCVAATDIAYVSADAAGCTNAAHDSTPSTPYCQISAAVNLDDEPYVLVAGGATAYGTLPITASTADRSVVIVGPGSMAAVPARISTPSASGLTASAAAGRTLDVRLQGFLLEAPSGTTTSCTGAGTVKLQLRDLAYANVSTAINVDAQACTVDAADVRVDGTSTAIDVKQGRFEGRGLRLADASTSGLRAGGGVVIVRDSEISGAGAYGVRVEGTTADVTLEGVTVDRCVAGVQIMSGKLVIRDSTIQRAMGGGVSQMGGDSLVERSRILENNTGSSFYGGTYRFVNNVTRGNGQGAYLGPNATGTFAFNTLIGNMGETINCGAGKTVARSIVVGNKLQSGSQFQGCTLSEVVTGPDNRAGAIQLVPVLTAQGDLDTSTAENLAANQACCIDKVAPGADVPADDHLKRTRGPIVDLGAFEAP